jgi:AcrR family transcriptional regulator
MPETFCAQISQRIFRVMGGGSGSVLTNDFGGPHISIAFSDSLAFDRLSMDRKMDQPKLKKEQSSKKVGSPVPKRRLVAEDRREDILLKSIKYFARHGFEGNTRDLAKEIGVTQSLLYRYFPSKADLIDAVFNEMYTWQRQFHWEAGLSDRSRPIAERMIAFFTAYAERTYTYEWIRLYTFAGLLDGALNRRHIRRVADPILRRICVEVAVESGHAERDPEEVTQNELDVLWILHAGLYYFAIRKFLYGEEPHRSLDFPIREGVNQTVRTLKELLSAGAPSASDTQKRASS